MRWVPKRTWRDSEWWWRPFRPRRTIWPRPFHLRAEARGGRRALRDLGGHPARARPPPAGRPPADHALSLRPLRQGEPGHARGRRARVPRRPAHLGRSASAARGLGHGLGAPARARPRSLQSPRLPAGRRSAPHSLALEREDGAARRARDGGRDHRGHAPRPPGHGRAGSGPARSRAVRGRLRHRASDPRRLGRGAGWARDRGASRPRTGAVTAHPDRPRPLPPGGVPRRARHAYAGLALAPRAPHRARLMRALLALRLITYLLVCAGVGALALAGLLAPLGTAIVALALLGNWCIDQVRKRLPVRPALGWALIVTAAIALVIDLFYLAQRILDGMVHLLLFLILLRLFRRRSLKDLRDAGFLSFFMLVAASAVTFNVSFLFVFIAFLILGTWMLILHHLAGESERAAPPTPQVAAGGIGPPGPPLPLSPVGAARPLPPARVMFLLLPPPGPAPPPFRAELGRRISGFTDHVELGAYGEIETDTTVVMRVRFPADLKDPERLPNLRWRGLAFDRF